MVDAIDSVKAKVALIAFCKRNEIPVIVAGSAGGQWTRPRITMADLAKTIQDPLAARCTPTCVGCTIWRESGAQVRGGVCLYSTEQLQLPGREWRHLSGQGGQRWQHENQCPPASVPSPR